MSVIERSITYKLEWSSTAVDTKSDEISLHDSKMCCIGVKLNPRTFSHILYFVCKSKQPSVLEISDVFFSTCSSSENRIQMKLLSHEGPHQVFSCDVLEWKTPLNLTCWVTLKEKVEGFSYQLIDGLLTDQLLASTENERLTDVKFVVGLMASKKKTFAAHRSILAARSPVLAELFEKEDVTLPIEIIDAQPSVFQDFLQFIYTGKFKGCSASSLIELQALADRFQIKNLQKICRQPIQEMNVSELTSLVMSLSQPTSRVDNNNNTGLFGNSFAPTHISPLFTGTSFSASAATFPSTNSVLAQTQSLLASRTPLFSNTQTPTPTSSNSGFNFFSVSKPDTPASFNFTGSSPSTAFQNSPAFSFVKVEGAGALLNSLRRPFNGSTATAVNAPILIASTIGTSSVFNSGPILSTSAVSTQTTTSVSSAHVNSTSLHNNFCASIPITTSVSYTRASIRLTDRSSTLPGPSGMNNVLCNEAASAATHQPLTQNK